MKKIINLTIITVLSVLFIGCGQCKNAGNLGGTVKTSPDGISYKIVEIEGKRFIATQSAYNYWTLAGPIN